MSTYKYQTTVKVPAEVISRIGTDIGVQFFGQLNVQLPHLEGDDVKLIMAAYGDAVREHAGNNMKSVDGWTLDSHTVTEIVHCLRNGQKINAIKHFRAATNACLIDSKSFIERYETNAAGAQKLLEEFTE